MSDRTKLSIEGVEVEVDLLENGMLEVYRDGVLKGMLLLLDPPTQQPPEPEPPLPAMSAVGDEPQVLPPGWYFDGDVLMMGGVENEDGQLAGGYPVNVANRD